MWQWSAIVLTCRSADDLAAAYHQELRFWQKKGVFPSTTEIIVVEDPSPDLGSGGATLNAILVVTEQLSASNGLSVLASDVIRDARILVVHIGRPYRHEPCGAAAFLALPNAAGWITPTQCRVPLTPLLHTYLTVTSLAAGSGRGNGVWVCGSDSLLVLDQSAVILQNPFEDQADILLFSIPVDPEYAAGKHGVYRLDEQNLPQEIVYRGSMDQISTCCLSTDKRKAALVLALVHLKPVVAISLLHLQTPLDRCTYLGVDTGAASLQLSFFFDFLAATFANRSEVEFASGNVSSAPYFRTADALSGDQNLDDNAVVLARRFIWRTLSGYKTRVVLLPYLYYHYFIDDRRIDDQFLAEIAPVLQKLDGLYVAGRTEVAHLPMNAGRTSESEDKAGSGDNGVISTAFSRRRFENFQLHLRIIDDVLINNRHECLLPIFLNSCIDGFAKDLLSHLDQIAIECRSTSVTGRTLSCIADVLGFWARGHGGLRSGPAQNLEWLDALQMLEDGKIESGIRRMADLRSRWSARPDRLIRSARHYEAAAQVFTRRTVMDSVRNYIRPIRKAVGHFSSGDHMKFDSRLAHKVEAAARIDWSGGWSDTPPITYENGGAVLNIAVLIDGKRPIGAICRRIESPELTIITRHYGEIVERLHLKNVDEIRRYKNPGAPGALVCATLVCTEVVNPGDDKDTRTLSRRLLEDWGGGFQITVWSNLPHGSGMGSSSILAGCIVAAIWTATTGVKPDVDAVLNTVLYVEQLLTTGGGWQDQVGGLCPGVKIGRFESDVTWSQACGRPRLTYQPVKLTKERQRWLNQHFLVVYTGKTRLAKNLLQEVVRSWYARKPEIVHTVGALVENAETAKKAFETADWSAVAACARKYWDQKKLMAGGGCEPERVTGLLEVLYRRQLIRVGWLAGAGGGGFLYLMTTRPDCKGEVEKVLLELGHDAEDMKVHTVCIDDDPFHVEAVEESGSF